MSECVVRFKPGVDPDQWNYLHPRVHSMFELLAMIFDKMDYDLEITSMVRPKTSDSGVHATGRALDCMYRMRSTSKFKLQYDNANKIAAFMCSVFRNPGDHPSCIYHNVGSGFHFHLQVRPDPEWTDLKGEIPIKVG